MPANLTPQYHKAEEEYRRATTLEEELNCLQCRRPAVLEELNCLQVMLQEIPKHKGTDHLQAQLKSKIAKAKRELTWRHFSSSSTVVAWR